MKLQNIKVSEAKQSPTNTKGRGEGKGFDELVASIKEKGVLMPVLARVNKGGKPGDPMYEIIAGNRRLAAAKEAGLTEIPAQIVEMNDVEAREAQIVENLQRQDIHPLDEGEAYRKLIETSRPHYEVKDIAIKVGKSDTYVRQRLALTNLSEKAGKNFRDGNLSVTDAILLSRIEDDKLQNEALKKFTERDWDYDRVREWIQNETYIKALKNPKGLVMGVETNANLFGDKALGVDPVSFGQKIALLIDNKIKEAQKKGEKIVKISTMYGEPEMKGVLGKTEYKILTSKEDKKNAKEQIRGVVVEGDNLGMVYVITTDPSDLKEKAGGSAYKLSDKEKAERKKEAEKNAKIKEAGLKKYNEVINKIKMPLSEKHLNALFELILDDKGFSYQQPVSNALGLDPVMVKSSYGEKTKDGKIRMVKDYEATLRNYASSQGPNGKLRVIFALLMSLPDPRYMENFNNDIKKVL